MNERATARRAAIRLHHPDAGGSAAALAEALAEIDRTYRRADSTPITIVHRGPAARARALVVAVPLRIVLRINGARRRYRTRTHHLKDHS